jgi:hypothetical protein
MGDPARVLFCKAIIDVILGDGLVEKNVSFAVG